jgi:hypothetical protein
VRPKQVVAAHKVHKGVPPVAAAVCQVLPDVRGVLISARDDGFFGVGGGVPPVRAPAPVEVDKGQDAALGKFEDFFTHLGEREGENTLQWKEQKRSEVGKIASLGGE